MYTLQPEKKSPGCLHILAAIGVVALVAVGVFAFAILRVASGPTYADPASSTHHVVYKATTSRPKSGGCFGFDATYEMPSGTSQQGGGACGISTSVVVDERTARSGDFLYLAIQNDEWVARIGCEIWVDGTLAFRNYSEGQYVIASCSGSTP